MITQLCGLTLGEGLSGGAVWEEGEAAVAGDGEGAVGVGDDTRCGGVELSGRELDNSLGS